MGMGAKTVGSCELPLVMEASPESGVLSVEVLASYALVSDLLADSGFWR